MLYRTRFDPFTALWQLQIKEPVAWFLPSAWKTVMTPVQFPRTIGNEVLPQHPAEMNEGAYLKHQATSRLPRVPMSFESHGAAMDYVKKVGLDKQYSQAQPNQFTQMLTAGATA